MEIDINKGDLYRVYAGIHLDAIKQNILSMKQNMHENTKIMAVVKADGYGHGAGEIAGAIEGLVDGFAVATVEEALSLRKYGIQKMILILGFVHESLYEDVIKNHISLDIYTMESAKKLSALAQKLHKEVLVHLKLDTGMSRLGAKDDDRTLEMIAQIEKMPSICVEGIFTHFSSSDETDKTKTREQISRFERFLGELKKRELLPPLVHCSSSAAIIDMPEANYNMVRAGISLYGMYPSEEVHKEKVPLHAAMELKSHIVYLKEVEAGIGISYGATYVTTKRTRVATIPVGYGDGYPRALSNKGYVLIHGRKAPVIGRVCMDYFMVDVSEIEDAKEGDVVTLIGTDGAECITMEILAAMRGESFHYELACTIGKRIPRVFFENGKAIACKHYADLL